MKLEIYVEGENLIKTNCAYLIHIKDILIDPYWLLRNEAAHECYTTF